MRELIGVIIFIDGLLSAVFGHGFLRFLGRVKGPPIYHSVLNYFLDWDEHIFRFGAACQAAAGLAIFISNSKGK